MDRGLPDIFGYGGAAPKVGAGLAEGLTMRDRTAAAQSLERQGTPPAAIDTALGGPVPTPPERASYLGGALTVGQQMASDTFTGLADIGRDEDAWLPLPETVLGAVDAVGEALEPSQGAQDQLAARYQERVDAVASGEMSETEALARDVADGAAAGIVQMAPQYAATFAGAKAGAMAGRMAGPIGALVGAVAGGLGGTVLTYYPLARKESEQTAIANGLDPEDPEVRDQIDRAAIAKAVISTGGPAALWTRFRPQKAMAAFQSVLGKRTAGAAAAGATGEALTEVAEVAMDAVMLDPELREKLKEEEWAEARDYALERYGRDALVAGLSAGAAGGAIGGVSGAAAQSLSNSKIREDSRKLATTLAPLGLDSAAILAQTKTSEGAQKVRDAAVAIGRAETGRRLAMAQIPRISTEETLPGSGGQRLLDDESRARLISHINQQADEVIDEHAKKLGAPMRLADVRAQRADKEHQQRDRLTTQLKEQGLPSQVREDADPVVLKNQLENLIRTKDEVESRRNRAESIANPERRATERAKLAEAEIAARDARIEATMKLSKQPMTRVQAAAAVDTQERRENQRTRREQAVQKQRALEFPEAMAPELAQVRAAEIVEGYDNNPTAAEKGLRRKLSRLEYARRQATNPETIDRISDEIADLEARRGLPPPAVEAARRVLQAQGLVSKEVVASRPEASETELAAAREERVAATPEPKPTETSPTQEQAPPEVETPASPPRRAGSPTLATEFPDLRPRERPALAAKARKALASAQDMPAFAEAARRAGLLTDEGVAPSVAAQLVLADDTDQAIYEQTAGEAAMLTLEDQRLQGRDFDERNPWEPLIDVTGVQPTMEELYQRLGAWTAESGLEASATVAADGTVLGSGTNRLREGVYPPVQGYGDPAVTFVHTHTLQLPFSPADLRGMLAEHHGPYQAILPDGQVIEMRPLKRLSKKALNDLHRKIDEAALPLLWDQPPDTIWFVRQEALLRYLAEEGVIDYVTPIESTQAQRDLVYATIDAARENAAALLRAEPDGRNTAPEDGSPGRRASGQRTAVPEGIASAETRSRRKRRAAADPERIKALSDRILTGLELDKPRKRGRPSHLRDVLDKGLLDPAGVQRGLQVAVRGIGGKRGPAIADMVRTMYPGLLENPDNFEPNAGARYNLVGGGVRLRTKPAIAAQISSAIEIITRASQLEPDMFFYPTMRRVRRNRLNQTFLAQHHEASSALRAYVNFTGLPTEMLMVPLDNPDDTSNVTKKRSNRMSERSLEPARRTARYLQRNAYTIDKARLEALKPADLLSTKGLAGHGLNKDMIPRLEANLERMRTSGRRGPDAHKALPPAERSFMVQFGYDLHGQLNQAEVKLARLRNAVRAFEEAHPGEPIGFHYQIDDKGRIYADGEFNPAMTDAVMAVFQHQGRSLGDMVTIDASASGWQIAALMARDEELAPRINIGAGQANEPGFQKQDLYTDTITVLRTRVEAAANGPAGPERTLAKLAMRKLFGEPPYLTRPMIKTPIIAVNYAATVRNFIEHFQKALPGAFDGKLPKGMAGFLGREARAALNEVAPATMRIQEWAIATIEKVARAVEEGDSTADSVAEWTVGLDATFSNKKLQTKAVLLRPRTSKGLVFEKDPSDPSGTKLLINPRTGDPIPTGQLKESSNDEPVDLRIDRLDPAATARSIYSQMIQGFDASVMHRAVERYKRATNGAFVTTNHDAFTVPLEHEGAMASAVRESLHEIMRQVDLPQRIYDEAVANLAKVGKTPKEVGITPPPAKGAYNIDDVLTSVPAFSEDATREDAVPPFAELPAEGRELARAQADSLTDVELAQARDVDVANYMAQYEETAGLLKRVNNVISDPKESAKSWAEWIDTQGFNAFSPIRRLEVQLKGELPQGMDSAFKAAELAISDSGRNEALLYYGAPMFSEHGAFTTKPGTMGLRDIWKLAGGTGRNRGQRLQHWLEYMAARRAQALHREGIKTPLTDADISTALGRETPEFVQAAEEWKKFNDASLDFLEASGRISQAQKAAMQADDFYVPFYRSDQRVDGTSPDLILPDAYTKSRGPKAAGGGLLRRDPGIMAIKGGDRQRIDNLMHNMIRNSQAMVAAAMRNVAANKTFDLLQQADLADTADGRLKKPRNGIEMWRDGEALWIVPRGEEAAPYVLALAGLTPVQRGRIAQLATDISSAFRQSITLTPPFLARNWYRGAVATGILTSGSNLTMTSNTLTGFVETLGSSAATKAFKAQSGMGDYRFGSVDIGLGRNDVLIEYGLNPKTVGYHLRSAINAMEGVGTATELGDRVAAYKSWVKRGVRPDEAAYQALTIMNYSRRGASPTLRVLLPMMPFLNARLQGWARLAEGSVSRKGSTKHRMGRMLLNGALMSIASTTLMQQVLSDDEDRERYLGEPLWKRLNYHIVYGDGTTYLIPKAFELGYAFSSFPELVLTSLVTGGADNEIGPGTIKMLADTLMFNFIPQAALPLLEVMTNWDMFRGRPVEGLRESSLLPEERVGGASELAVFIGRDLGLSGLTTALGNALNLESTALSPARLEQLLQGYGGIAWGMLSTVFGIVAADLDLIGVEPLAAKQVDSPFGETPILSPALRAAFGFAAKDTDLQTTRFVEEYYRASDHVTQIMRTARENARRTGDLEAIARAKEILAENPKAETAYRLINKARVQMGELNTAYRLTRQDRSLTREEMKRKLVPIQRARNKLARGVVEAVRALEAEQGRAFANAGT